MTNTEHDTTTEVITNRDWLALNAAYKALIQNSQSLSGHTVSNPLCQGLLHAKAESARFALMDYLISLNIYGGCQYKLYEP